MSVKERAKFMMEWERRWNEGEGPELCRAPREPAGRQQRMALAVSEGGPRRTSGGGLTSSRTHSLRSESCVRRGVEEGSRVGPAQSFRHRRSGTEHDWRDPASPWTNDEPDASTALDGRCAPQHNLVRRLRGALRDARRHPVPPAVRTAVPYPAVDTASPRRYPRRLISFDVEPWNKAAGRPSLQRIGSLRGSNDGFRRSGGESSVAHES